MADLKLTMNEISIMVSLVEMTTEEATVTFADWLDSNPDNQADLESLEAKLRAHEADMLAEVRRRRGRQATLQLHPGVGVMEIKTSWEVVESSPLEDLQTFVGMMGHGPSTSD